MNAKTSSHERSVLLSQDEVSEYLAAFGGKEVYLREVALLARDITAFKFLVVSVAVAFDFGLGFRLAATTGRQQTKQTNQ